jgi:hypothetical protein
MFKSMALTVLHGSLPLVDAWLPVFDNSNISFSCCTKLEKSNRQVHAWACSLMSRLISDAFSMYDGIHHLRHIVPLLKVAIPFVYEDALARTAKRLVNSVLDFGDAELLHKVVVLALFMDTFEHLPDAHVTSSTILCSEPVLQRVLLHLQASKMKVDFVCRLVVAYASLCDGDLTAQAKTNKKRVLDFFQRRSSLAVGRLFVFGVPSMRNPRPSLTEILADITQTLHSLDILRH